MKRQILTLSTYAFILSAFAIAGWITGGKAYGQSSSGIISATTGLIIVPNKVLAHLDNEELEAIKKVCK